MAATIYLFQHFFVQVEGKKYDDGSLTDPVSISIDGKGESYEIQLATATTLDLWAASSGKIADFDFFWLKLDQDVYVELTTDTNNGVGDEVYVLEADANKAFVLCSDTGLANYTANFGTVTADVVDRIRLRNVSGSTAKGRAFLFT